MIRMAFLQLLLAAPLTLMACGNTAMPENRQGQKGTDMNKERQEIAAFIERRNRAMIDRDTLALGSMMSDDLTLVHITGATQSKREWLDEIARESMRYYHIETKDLSIEKDGDNTVARYTSVIEARIWGAHGTWTLNSVMHLQRIGNGWLWCNPR